jgi:tRNA(fMet)-specific endonuclease VapC
MMYLIDSDWIVDWLKNKPDAVHLLRTIAPDGLAISLVSVGEIYEGIYFGHDPSRYERAFRQFLRGVTVLPLSRQTMQRFARVCGDLRRTVQIIGDFDILIGATALQHALTLVTQKRHHFQRSAGLALYP